MRFNASRVKSRLAPARARRPHREAGNADDAVLLAERVQHLARFFRQANDPLRSAHKPSLVCRYGPALPGAALAGARCHSTHLASNPGSPLRARGGRTVKPEMPTMRSCSPSAYSTSQGSSVTQTLRSGPRINPPWCVATARPSLAVRSPARDAIQDISRKLRLTFGEADDAARTRHGFSNR